MCTQRSCTEAHPICPDKMQQGGNVRVMRIVALLLVVVSAISFSLTIYNILTTEWNIGEGFFGTGSGHGNWWEGTWSFNAFERDYHNWFLRHYHNSWVLLYSQ